MKYVQFFSVVVILTFVETGGVKQEGLCMNSAFVIFVILSFKEY